MLNVLILELVVDGGLQGLFQVKLWNVEDILADLTNVHTNLRNFLIAVNVTHTLKIGTHVVKQTTEAFGENETIPFFETFDSCRSHGRVTVHHFGDEVNVNLFKPQILKLFRGRVS